MYKLDIPVFLGKLLGVFKHLSQLQSITVSCVTLYGSFVVRRQSVYRTLTSHSFSWFLLQPAGTLQEQPLLPLTLASPAEVVVAKENGRLLINYTGKCNFCKNTCLNPNLRSCTGQFGKTDIIVIY